jgi:hypothetical protein
MKASLNLTFMETQRATSTNLEIFMVPKYLSANSIHMRDSQCRVSMKMEGRT